MPSRMRSALPAMSPTVAFIWQRARRIGRIVSRLKSAAPGCRCARCVAFQLICAAPGRPDNGDAARHRPGLPSGTARSGAANSGHAALAPRCCGERAGASAGAGGLARGVLIAGPLGAGAGSACSWGHSLARRAGCAQAHAGGSCERGDRPLQVKRDHVEVRRARRSRRAARTRDGRRSSSRRCRAPGAERAARPDTGRVGAGRADTAGTAARARW